MASTYESILSDLKKRAFKPVYVLSGEEPYYIDALAEYIEKNVLQDQEKEFNQSILYGADLNAPTLVSYLKRYPMMAEYQVIIVREAQEMKDVDELEAYMEKPMKTSILVLCYKHKKFDQRKKIALHVAKNGELLVTKKLYDNQVPDWISQYLKREGYTIDPKAAAMVAEYVGTDLSHIVMELGKLRISLPAGTHVTDKIVEQNIGISKEYNVFELQKALGDKNIFKSNQIAHYLMANPKDNPIVMIIPILYKFFAQLMIYHALEDKSRASAAAALGVSPYFIQDYQKAASNYTIKRLARVFDLLHEYDLKSKGIISTNADEPGLLQELIWKILH